MKNIVIISSLFLLCLGSSCKKDYKKDCVSSITACSETPPTDELCQAAFNRWFYNSNTNTCELIGYSGCSQKGFETKQECDSCKCN